MKKIEIKGKNSYYVFIGEKIIYEIGRIVKNSLNFCCKVVVVTDDVVFKLYGKIVEDSLKRSGFFVYFFILKEGEKSKNLKNLEKIYAYLCSRKITRKDLILGLGGGMVGDFSGFVAATYLRGVKFVSVPTTLLSQVDSSIGGKNGVNLSFGKNLVGTITSPFLVLTDVFFLKTLSKRAFNSGIAEVVKYAVTFSKELYEILNKNKIEDYLEKIVFESVKIKKNVVEKDEFEKNVRMKLNFGHTVGHALEKYYNYRIYHGEAVSIGMCYITEKSFKNGLTRFKDFLKLKFLLRKFGLPTVSNVNFNAIFNNMLSDKKIFGNDVNFCIIKKLWHCEIMSLPINEFEEFLKK